MVTAFRFFLNAEDTLRRDALSAIHEHLNDGGLLVSNIHMNATSPMGLVCRFLNRIRGRVVRSTLSIHAYRQMLVSNGFVVERVIGYGFCRGPGGCCQGFAKCWSGLLTRYAGELVSRHALLRIS